MKAQATLKTTSTPLLATGSRLFLQRKCACGGPAGPSGTCKGCSDRQLPGRSQQAQLVMGSPDDPLEQEADRLADQVLGTPADMKTNAGFTRFQKPAFAPSGGSAAPESVHNALRHPGRPLDSTLRHRMERGFRHDFSSVRVHSDAEAHRSAADIGAHAYTVGERIVFAQGRYSPGTMSGMRLIGHELAHVVQQSGMASTPVQRQDASTSGPVAPTAAQQAMIDAARRAAAIRTQVASFRANGIEGDRWQREAVRLARIKFNWPRPNMEQIGEILSSMGGGLVTVRVMVAASGDPECGSRVGYVRGLRPPIVLCPGFFDPATSDESRIRTMVHEMAHARGIGDASTAEEYFPVFDCDSTGSFESADSWANYVHCLSGQPPDQPETLIGDAPGGGGP